MIYIKNWYSAFAYAHAARHARVSWRRKPVDHNSIRFRHLMQTPGGCVAYCVFEAAVDLVVRNRSEGVLEDAEKRPIGPREVSLSAGIPLAACKTAFKLLQSKQIGWLSDTDIRGQSTNDPPTIQGPSTEHGPRLDQIRSDKTREDKSCSDRSGLVLANGAMPCSDRTDQEAAIGAMVACGLEPHEAAACLAMPEATAKGLYHAAKRTLSEMASGNKIKSPRAYILSIAKLTTSVADQTLAAKANVKRSMGIIRLAEESR